MNKNIKIAIIGLGYVGLPLSLEFGKKFRTIGFDISKKRIQSLKNNNDFNKDIELNKLKKSKYLTFTNNEKIIFDCNYFIITVPTPIFKNNKPNLNSLKSASLLVSKYLKRGDIVIYESTVYPGVTEEVCVPILEKNSGLKYNEDFYCGYSPERINPGDKKHTITNISKIVSGSNKPTLNKIYYLYKNIIKSEIFKSSSIKVAEAAKIIENSQRDINIAFINELTQIFDKLNISTNEVLRAASTKWNFLNFKPGFVGGHCISVDPYYLAYKAKKVGIRPQIILSGRKTNDQMHKYVLRKLQKKLNLKTLSKLNVLIMGYTFKENCSDYRNTKIQDLYLTLKSKFKVVNVFDPYINLAKSKKINDVNFIQNLKKLKYDVVLIAVGHDYFKKLGIKKIRSILKNNNSIIFDLKYLFKTNETDLQL